MYRSSVLDLPPRDTFSRSQELAADLRHINALQPRVEPEIVFGLAKPVRAAMSDLEILNSIAWIAHGYEIVGSIFPDWKSTPTDSTAAFGMHQLLLAVSHIHTNRVRVFHRNIDVVNILYDEDGSRLRLTNFELATMVYHSPSPASLATGS